jgi:paraquat-inducible protein B
MSATHDHHDGETTEVELRAPVVRRRTRLTWLIWLVPAVAAVAACVLLAGKIAEHGSEITVRFADGDGIRSEDTPLKCRGMEVGKVTEVLLSPDRSKVDVHIRLWRGQEGLARTGSTFWVVRPDFTNGSLSGISTVVSGAYVEVAPGGGDAAATFPGLASPPVVREPGLNILLLADHVNRAEAGTPVYYRGVQVGVVSSTELSLDATRVVIYATVESRYAPLVRSSSEFWSLKVADVSGGVFSGVQLKIGSLRSLFSGGIEFATPEDDRAPLAHPDARFVLHDDADPKWLAWSPRIVLAPEATSRPEAGQPEAKLPPSARAVQSAVEPSK